MQSDTAKQVNRLIALKGEFSITAAAQKQALLEQLSGVTVADASLLKSYHECLLFLLAYPGHKQQYELALQQLQNLSITVQKIFSSYASKKQTTLNGSGIFSSELVCAFSYEISLWLCNIFGNSIGLHSSGANEELISSILEPFLPGMEYEEITQGKCGLPKRIQKLTGQKNSTTSLQWLLNILHNKTASPRLRNTLYEQLQVYVHWKLDHPFFNRTFLRSLPPQKIYYQRPKTFIKNYRQYIRKKIKLTPVLSAEEKKRLLNIARTALALHNRETDPITFGDSSAIKYFHMGNGISIALYSMLPQNRFSIESYIGYMAFVNSVPAAYGGGWLLGYRCKIGINIFPALRGGNSTLLFAAILRLYHQYFNAKRFVVKPYQFGKNNPDGLRTGAFWFYYKLGFRPAGPFLLKLAKEEYQKKLSLKNYRTAPAVLKKFTAAPLELLAGTKAFPGYDAGLISKAVTKNIIQDFNGNRQQALQYYTKQLNKLAGSAGKKLSASEHQLLAKQAAWIAVLFPPGNKMNEWTTIEKQQLISLLLSKYAADERDYIILLQRHKKIWEILNETIQPNKN